MKFADSRPIPFARKTMCPLLVVFLVAGVIVVWQQPPSALAQETAFPAAPQATAPKRLTTLKAALDVLYWDADRRGPLLVIAPERVRPWQPNDESDEIYRRPKSPDPLFAPPDGDLRAEIAAPYFGRKIVHCGTMTVLAPTEMVLLNTQLPPKPDPLSGIDRSERLRMLQASLTPAQWRTLGSPSGLGAGDLDGTQKALFLSLLPNPFRVIRGKTSSWGGTMVEWKDGDNPNLALNETERNAVRVRINRAADIQLLRTDNRAVYETQVTPKAEGQPSWTLNTQNGDFRRGEKYGTKLRAEVPNRLKGGTVDFEAPALDPAVMTDGTKTVGDLVGAIRAKTGVEIYVDGRAAKLSVWWGDNGVNRAVRAGDLLKSLCWALTGTVRKVGPGADGKFVYVLTDDLEGIGMRRARIQAWLDAGSGLLEKMRADCNKKIAAQQPLQYLTYTADDPFAPKPSVEQKIQEKWKTQRGRYEGAVANLSELTEAQQQRVQAALTFQQAQQKARSQQSNARPQPEVMTDRVSVSVRTSLTYLVPGVGEVPTSETPWDSLTTMLPPAEKSGYEEMQFGTDGWRPSSKPVTLPTTLPLGAALCILPRTADEAVAAVTTAKRQGLRALWIETADTDTPESRALLMAGITAGKERGLPVYAVVHLMQSNASTPPDAKDLNILGETSGQYEARRAKTPDRFSGVTGDSSTPRDLLRPDATATLPTLRKRLAEIAALPGIAGIVLKEAATPGYSTPDASSEYSFFGRNAADFGYTDANRVALIRKAGYDPVDLTLSYSYDANLTLPQFTTQGGEGYYGGYEPALGPEVSKAWNHLRYEKQAALWKEIYGGIRAANASLPILLTNPEQTYNIAWVALWESGDTLPKVPDSRATPPRPAADSGKTAKAPIAKNLLMSFVLSPAMLKIDSRSTILGNGPLPEPGSPPAFSLITSYYVKTNLAPSSGMMELGFNRPKYEGMVFDLTAFPTPQALRYIDEGLTAPSNAPVRAEK